MARRCLGVRRWRIPDRGVCRCEDGLEVRPLAKALGEEAHKEYRATDADGNSSFNPMHYLGQEVSILVEDCIRNGGPSTRIKKVDPLDRPNDWDKEDLEPDDRVNDDPSPPGQAVKPADKDDDIPF